MKLKIRPVSPRIGTDIPFPFYASAGAAAMDLCACVDEAVTIAPQQIVSLPTGIAIALPSAEYVALVFARSGLGIKHGVALANGEPVPDPLHRAARRPHCPAGGDAGGAGRAGDHRYPGRDPAGSRRLRLHRKIT